MDFPILIIRANKMWGGKNHNNNNIQRRHSSHMGDTLAYYNAQIKAVLHV